MGILVRYCHPVYLSGHKVSAQYRGSDRHVLERSISICASRSADAVLSGPHRDSLSAAAGETHEESSVIVWRWPQLATTASAPPPAMLGRSQQPSPGSASAEPNCIH
jgi:hypothetical protein